MTNMKGAKNNACALALIFALAYGLSVAPFVALSVGIQLAVYLAHGLPFRSERFFDLSGSVTHFALVFYSLTRLEAQPRSTRQIGVALCSTIWLTRLGSFLFLRIEKDGRDERFDSMKKFALAFLGAWTIQALWVVVVQLPIILVNDRVDTVPLGLCDLVGAILWVAGFVCEVGADVEKFIFRCDPSNKGRFITSGLWRYSRHPNFFGEIAMWSGLALVVAGARDANLAADSRLAWAWLSPAFTTALLMKVSGVPMIEKAGRAKWGGQPDYDAYMKGTSCLIPWFPAPPATDASKKAA